MNHLIRRNNNTVEVLSDFGWVKIPPALLEGMDTEPLGREIETFLDGTVIDTKWEYLLLQGVYSNQ